MMAGGFSAHPLTAGAENVQKVTLPYVQRFDTEQSLRDFTLVDANEDGYTWAWDNGTVSYNFNKNEDADDWLITPSLDLDTDYVYKLSFTAFAESGGVERLAVNLGDAASAEGMSQQLMPVTIIDPKANVRSYSFIFRPGKASYSYVGFHALSKKESGYKLSVDNISVSMLLPANRPDSVTNLKAIADPTGKQQATLSFTLPQKAIDGTLISDKMDAAIICWGDTLKKFSDCKPGEKLQYVHNSDATGSHTYTVVAKDTKGWGLESKVSTYLGDDAPGEVDSLNLEESSPSTLRLSWKAPSKGLHGGHVGLNGLTYSITDMDGKVMTTDHSPLEYSFTKNENRQQLKAFTIQAYNSLGKGPVSLTDTLFVGNPYKIPFIESFSKNRLASYPWILQDNSNATWEVTDRGLYADPMDHDGGLLSFSNGAEGASATAIMPKVSIKGSKHPMLKFWWWTSKREANELYVIIRDDKGCNHTIAHLSQQNSASDEGQWEICSYSLADFANTDYVQVKFCGVGHPGINPIYAINIDDVSITDVPENDLSVDSFTVDTTQLKVGESIELNAKVTNRGINTASGCMLNLLRNGQVIKMIPIEELAADSSVNVHYVDRPNADVPETSYYSVRLDWSADEVTDNNTKPSIAVTILPGLPFVDSLRVQSSDKGYTLTWNKPTINNMKAHEVTEGFESYPAFTTTNFGQWTLIDGDQRPTVGIMDATGNFIDYDHAGDAMAYQVFNPVEAGLTTTEWSTHSGSQVAAAFTCGQYAQNDDWLISPLVDGAQKISFWAKSPANNEYGTNERIEVCYSTTDVQKASFQRVGSVLTIPGTWTQYTASLPENAKYFAIHCISNNQYILFLDDITYRKAASQLTLLGYNIYRDGMKLNVSPLTATTFTDQNVTAGSHTYVVTAVYEEGESTPSPEAVVSETDGITRTLENNNSISQQYNVMGQIVKRSSHGIVLQRMSDGSVRKVMK